MEEKLRVLMRFWSLLPACMMNSKLAANASSVHIQVEIKQGWSLWEQLLEAWNFLNCIFFVGRAQTALEAMN